jgi:hypothetical protein
MPSNVTDRFQQTADGSDGRYVVFRGTQNMVVMPPPREQHIWDAVQPGVDRGSVAAEVAGPQVIASAISDELCLARVAPSRWFVAQYPAKPDGTTRAVYFTYWTGDPPTERVGDFAFQESSVKAFQCDGQPGVAYFAWTDGQKVELVEIRGDGTDPRPERIPIAALPDGETFQNLRLAVGPRSVGVAWSSMSGGSQLVTLARVAVE